MPKLSQPRKKRTVTVRPDLYQWMEEQIAKDRFWNFSHAIETALEKLGDAKKGKKRRLEADLSHQPILDSQSINRRYNRTIQQKHL